MRDQYQGRALRPVEFQHEFDDLTAGSGIKVAGRFVGEKHLGLGDEGAGKRHTLLFTAGEMFGQMVGTGAQTYLLQRYFGTLARILRRQPAPAAA